MRINIPEIFLSDSPVVGGDFREPFNLQPIGNNNQGSGDLSASDTNRDKHNLPVVDLRTDSGQMDTNPALEVEEPAPLFEQTRTQYTLRSDDGTLVRFTDLSDPNDPSTAQQGKIRVETPFFSGPDGSAGAFLELGHTQDQAFAALTDDSPDVPVIVGGHGLERIAAGLFGVFDTQLGEDMNLRISGRAGVLDQRPIDPQEAAQIVYGQTVTTLEGMIHAGLGDATIGGSFQQEGAMTVAQLHASVMAGNTNLRLEGRFDNNGVFSPRLVFTMPTDGRDLTQDDTSFHNFPQLPENAFEIYIDRDPENGGTRIGGNIRATW